MEFTDNDLIRHQVVVDGVAKFSRQSQKRILALYSSRRARACSSGEFLSALRVSYALEAYVDEGTYLVWLDDAGFLISVT